MFGDKQVFIQKHRYGKLNLKHTQRTRWWIWRRTWKTRKGTACGRGASSSTGVHFSIAEQLDGSGRDKWFYRRKVSVCAKKAVSAESKRLETKQRKSVNSTQGCIIVPCIYIVKGWLGRVQCIIIWSSWNRRRSGVACSAITLEI